MRWLDADVAGYSGTPLAKKLGVKPGHHVLVHGAPAGFAGTLELPEGARLTSGPEATAPVHVAILFAAWERDLLAGFAAVRPLLPDDGALWIAWPKKASGVPTDLVEDRLRALLLPTGLVDNKVCAIDETWSGLRFVLRKQLRG